MASASISQIPLELRYQIYRELVITCLSEECTSDIGGIYLSCHQYHNEIEDECISKARPLLEILQEWRSEWRAKHGTAGKLDLHLANNNNFAESIQNPTVIMPSTMFPSVHKGHNIDGSFEPAIKCLRRAFRLPHSTLRLGVSVMPKDPPGTVVKSFYRLIYGLYKYHDGELVFGRTKRLVFQFWFRHDEPTDAIESIRSTITLLLGDEFRKGEERWVAMEPDEGGRVLWSCGFDIEGGLPEAEGIVPRYRGTLQKGLTR